MFSFKGNHVYLLELEHFNTVIVEDFISSFGKTLLLLGDGIFVDAYSLKKKFGNTVYIQRVLNMYQMQKTVLEDIYEDSFSIFLVLRLSEVKDWKEGILLNISRAMEGLSRLSGKPSLFYLVQDEEYVSLSIKNAFRYRILEVSDKWEEIPQVLEWK